MYPGTMTPPPRSSIVKTPIQQGLAAPPIPIQPIAYRPRPIPRIVGESPFANRIRAGRERLGLALQEEQDALDEAAPILAAQAQASAQAINAAVASQQPAAVVAQQFADAGQPVTEDTAFAIAAQANDAAVAASVIRMTDVMYAGNVLPAIDPVDGTVTPIDVSGNQPVLQAQQAAAASAYRPPTGGGGPLVTPLTAPTPEQNAAAAVFGQDVPSPQTVLAAQVAAAPSQTQTYLMVAGALVLAYVLFRKKRA